jgi:hypothetical protein
LNEEARFQGVNLVHAEVGGNIIATKSTFQGDLDLSTAHVKGSVQLFGSEFARTVICSGATIEGVLGLSSHDQRPTWNESAELDLEGTAIKGLDDAPEAWPRRVKLAGLVIQQTHGQDTAPGKGFIDRDFSWYRDWLSREEGFSREPYKQLESLLRSTGRNRVADAVAIERINHEYDLRGGFWGPIRTAVGFLHHWTVGYGYRPEWAILWIIPLIALGWFVAGYIPQSNLDKAGVVS